MGRPSGGAGCVMRRRARIWSVGLGLWCAAIVAGPASAYSPWVDYDLTVEPLIRPVADTDRVSALRAQAYAALRADDWRHGMRVSREWANLDPEDDTPWVLLAWAHAERGDFVSVVAAYNRAIDINPRQRPPVWRSLAVAYTTLQRHDYAVSAYARAAEINPSEPNTWFDLCEAHLRNAEPAQAIRAAQQAIQREADYAEAWACRGSALVREQRLEDALIAFRRAIDGKTMEPRTDRAAFWRSLGWVYHQLDRADGVQEAVEGISRWSTDAAERFREQVMAGRDDPRR
ncbi:MAG: tetratricopeptide repeat protein [Sterolibacteriaceae bacterium]|nr:tetratricopeptide repeat protein [Candidatus Methylophosphatis haderslevensis]